MKKIIRQLFFIIGTIWFFPLIIPYCLTSEKSIILADVKRWVELLGWQERPSWLQLIILTKEAPEFRNLYYFRLLQGNLIAKTITYLFKIIYHQSPTFFLDNSCKIGSGLFIQHGFSTIIMADMGENCWVNQQVTIGYKDKSGRPQIGNNVRITAGAKVLGNIVIGDNVTIGANAVVIKNIPNNCVVVGVPAYIIEKDGVKVKQELV